MGIESAIYCFRSGVPQVTDRDGCTGADNQMSDDMVTERLKAIRRTKIYDFRRRASHRLVCVLRRAHAAIGGSTDRAG